MWLMSKQPLHDPTGHLWLRLELIRETAAPSTHKKVHAQAFNWSFVTSRTPGNPFKDFQTECVAVKKLKERTFSSKMNSSDLKTRCRMCASNTEGLATYFCSHWGPLGWDGRILSCTGTCICPTQSHGRRWECTARHRMRRKMSGD